MPNILKARYMDERYTLFLGQLEMVLGEPYSPIRRRGGERKAYHERAGSSLERTEVGAFYSTERKCKQVGADFG